MTNPAYARYEQFAAEIDAMRFMRAAGVDMDNLRTVDMFSARGAAVALRGCHDAH